MRTIDSAPSEAPTNAPASWPAGTARVTAIVALELLALSVIYNNAFDFTCRAQAPAAFCGFMSLLVVRALLVAAVTALALYPVRQHALQALDGAPFSRFWMRVNLIGVAAILLPWTFLSDSAGSFAFALSVLLWLGGAAAAAFGALFAVAEPARWLSVLRLAGRPLAAAAAVALVAPEITMAAQSFWNVDVITVITFTSAQALLSVFASDVVSDPDEVLLGVPDFLVLVGPQCSGIEGFALITGFTSLYLWIFRADLRFPLAFILLPIGILASGVLNIVRITGLILLGAHVSPELAVNGFHSHAGWLMFTILSLSLAAAAHTLPALRREGQMPARAIAGGLSPGADAPLPPLRQDWNVARLAPFIVFMATALLASTFSETPGVLYPARFAAMLSALWVFRELYRALPWRLDNTALAAGLAIAFVWVTTSPSDPDAAPTAMALALAAMPAWVFVVWAACRTLGTTFLVPLIEELLFRSYLLERLNVGGKYGPMVAVLISTGLFAALHDRWVAAALAGLVFVWVLRRRGNLTDAIVCHAAANGGIALWALLSGDWEAL